MPADNVVFCKALPFVLFYWEEEAGGATRTTVRLEFRGGMVLLDLTSPNANVESYAFDGERLHLRLSRVQRDVVAYPATIDLRTGLYYHHPDPRQASAPAGHATDLEELMFSGRHPPPHGPDDDVWWPSEYELNQQTPVRRAAMARTGARHGVEPGPDRSVTSADGAWRMDLWATEHTEAVANGTHKHYYRATLVRTSDGRATLDTRKTGHLVWVMEGAGEMQFRRGVSGGTPGETWTTVDMARGEWWEENFREPVGPTEPLESLARHLAGS